MYILLTYYPLNLLYKFFPEVFLIISMFFLIINLLLKKTYVYTKNLIKLEIYIFLIISLWLVKYLIIEYNIIFNNFYIKELNIFYLDSITLFIKIIIIIINVFFLISFINYIKYELIKGLEYIYIYIFLNLAFLLFVSTYDFIYMYLCLELSSLSIYILMSFKKYSTYATEASLKYFIMGGLSSCFIILGILMIYSFTSSTNIFDINLLSLHWNYINDLWFFFYIGLILITLGFTFKLGLFPFLMWVPDVYQVLLCQWQLFYQV